MIELNEEFKRALELLEHTSKNVFITGKAGSGKSTLLEYFRGQTKKKVAVLAPTGVAAVNVKGQTIHSFFSFKPDITFEKVKKVNFHSEAQNIYKKLDAIVIDEISMVRADLLDCADKFLRLNGKRNDLPFGGLQMIFIGDLYQLPPVVSSDEREIFNTFYPSPYFFDAHVFENLKLEFLELEKIYRQSDEVFINFLNSIRNNTVTEEELELINGRLDPDFQSSGEDFYIYLTTTNKLSDEINLGKLNKLKGKKFTFLGDLRGQFDTRSLPADMELSLKVGAQVMLVNNDSAQRWVNGTIGKVVGIEESDGESEEEGVVVELSDGKKVSVVPNRWEMFKFSFNEKTQSLQSETTGAFTQYPIKLAWSVTIHKSQGKTFDKVIIDIGNGTFAHGQMYVALSRCRTLSGIVLKKPIFKKHIWMDFRVVKFLTRFQYQLAEKSLSLDEKIRVIEEAIKNKQSLQIVYLKASDEKSKRVIKPKFLGEMKYLGKSFLGVEGFDSNRDENRNFRVDRILEIKEQG